ncbi:MAG TPA: outer membrane beta-barrel protein [Polyangia bacterium]|nr:outer membrane beta-barrel protein [Polyangia bacterium]
MAALATSWLLSSAPGRAQVTSEPSAVVFPDPAKFARGLYTEGEVGAVAFFGHAGDVVSPGFAVGARLGYDLTRWAALQLHVLGSTHQITGDNALNGQLLQTYQAAVEGKLTYRFGQTSIFAEGGPGIERLSTNALYVLGVEPQYRVGVVLGGGAGFDYHSLSRHFSIGVRGDFKVMQQLTSSQELFASTYLRYTF